MISPHFMNEETGEKGVYLALRIHTQASGS